MSLMKTLARVAMGVAVARGVSSLGRGARGRGRGGLLGGIGGMGGAGGAAALAAALGPLLAGRASGSRGLGGLLEGLGGAGGGGIGRAMDPRTSGGSGGGSGGGSALGGASGGLDGLLGGLLGGAMGGTMGGRASGGLLEQIAGRAPRPAGERQAAFGDVLNSAFDEGEPEIPPTPEQEAAAGLMLRAMVQAARADGVIDAEERRMLLGHLEGLSAEERRFVEEEMERPSDPEALAREVPEGLEPQVYAMSLMAIDVDTAAEADHLRRLARALRLEPDDLARIHEEVGAEPLAG